MLPVTSEEQIKELERSRALVGIFLDRAYRLDQVEKILSIREGFDIHARDSFHLLIPMKADESAGGAGYELISSSSPERYNRDLAGVFIERLEIQESKLPCIVFRATGNTFFCIELGDKDWRTSELAIREIATIAGQCKGDGPTDPDEFRKHVNQRVAK